MKHFEDISFSPVINLPKTYVVFDLTSAEGIENTRLHKYGIGKYLEHRPLIYKSELFQGSRNIHMGIDIQAPAGEKVYNFFDGVVWGFKNNDQYQDYGPTIILKHQNKGWEFYSLFGHLSLESLENLHIGQFVSKGSLLARVGEASENGGWPPHLHFQLSLVEPENVDMPGVVNQAELDRAVKTYPDPRLVLGPIY